MAPRVGIPRVLCALVIVSELGFLVSNQGLAGRELADPLAVRMVLIGYVAAVLVASFVSEAARRHFDRLLVSIVYLITTHSLYLLVLNDLAPSMVTGLCLVLAGAVATSGYTFTRRAQLTGYLGFVALGSIVAVVLAPAYRTPPAFFLVTALTLVGLAYVAVRALLGARERERGHLRRLQTLFEAFPDNLARVRDGRIEETYPHRGALGAYMAMLRGAPLERLAPDSGDRLTHALHTALSSGESQPIETEIEHGDQRFFAEIRLVGADAGEVLLIVRDRTEERRMSEQLVVSDRLAALGSLAFGLAHEINNPLAYVTQSIDYTLEALDTPSELASSATRSHLREILEEAREGTGRIARIVEDLKTSAHPTQTVKGTSDAGDAVRSALELADCQVRYHATVHTELEEVPPVTLTASRLTQVILNLVLNAVQALPGRSIEDNHIRIRVRSRSDRFAAVEIQDNGTGIPQSKLKHVFEPFFTTKPVGTGTGLGLYVTHQLVKAAGGECTIDSVEGSGTTVRLLLPITDTSTEAATRAPVSSDPPAPGHPAHVLVIDDDPAVGRSLKRLLRHHEVHLASDPEQGIREATAGSFDVILCDLMMPGTTGMELYERLPEALRSRVAFVTGGVHDPELRAFLDRIDARVIEKPFDKEQIKEVVAELFAQGESTPPAAEGAGSAKGHADSA